MATATTSTIIGLFDSRTRAENAVDALVRAGFTREQLSIITSDARSRADTPDLGPKDEISSEAGAGAAIGGIAGFIGGIVALAIPGIGPIIAAGPLAAGLMGAGLGAATGGIIGTLKSHGVPEDDASRFSEAIRRGRVMVAAQVSESSADTVADIMDSHGAIDVDEPEEQIPVGETTPGRVAPVRPLSPEAVESVRRKTDDSLVDRQRARERRAYVYPGFTGGGTFPSI
jgi:uncharacterized membrane protein